MNRDDLVEHLRDAFRAQGAGIVAGYVFGSRARGDGSPTSDVDVGVVLSGGKPRRLEDYPLDLSVDIERRLRLPVDLVVLNGASPDLIHRVLRDGIMVHEGDYEQRVEFEVRSRNEYFDIRPMLERHRKALIRSA